MPSNDLHLLDARLETRRQQTAPAMTPDNFFTLFVAEVILRRYQPGIPAILAGLTDGPGDCGIDGFYCFINGQPIVPGLDVASFGDAPRIEVHILQTKRSPKFTEDVLDKLQVHLSEILDLDRDERLLVDHVNPPLLDSSRHFVEACLSLAHTTPKFSFDVHYATRANILHPNTESRARPLADQLTSMFPEAEAEVHFYRPRELLVLARKGDTIKKKLVMAEGPLASDSDRGQGYVCLVDLEELFRFTCEPDSQTLHSAIFEANVRDHYNSSLVNKAISQTLSAESSPDFWWLNNGITIVTPKAQHMGKSLYIEDPQIVNGLQTSNEIHAYFKAGGKSAGRTVLIRVIRAADPEVRDKIIWATNNQNSLPPSALRATDAFQLGLEEFFEGRGFFYDRRKNSHLRIANLHVDRVISIEFLAQSMTACHLREPWRARRDEALLMNDDTYPRIFSDDIPHEAYMTSLLLTQRIREFLVKNQLIRSSSRYVEDYLFHSAAVATMLLSRKVSPNATDLAQVDPDRLSGTAVMDLISIVATEYSRFIGRVKVQPESAAAMDQKVSEALLNRVTRVLNSSRAVHWPEVTLQLDPGYFGAASRNSTTARPRKV